MFSKVKKSILLIMSLVLLIGMPMLVKADECNYGLCRTQEATGGLLPRTLGGAKNVPELVGVVISLVLGFLGIVFFLLVFYAGLIWMTARGDEGKIEDSKKTIEAAVIGLVIIMAAYALTQFVFTNLGAASTGTNTAPATLGCCVSSGDTSKCSANQLETTCQAAGGTWAATCPASCAFGPPSP